MKITDFSLQLSNYLGKYLPGIVGLSTNTILSYRDMFTLMLSFYEKELKISAEKLKIVDFNHDNIFKFLKWLETEHNNKVTTRNVRLAAIHAFAKYIERKCPEYMNEMQRIINIPFKKAAKGTLEYINIEAMQILLSIPNVMTKSGLRDAALLSLMYDSGCRVQELCDMIVSDIRLDSPSTARVTGKGKKTRIVPIMEPMKQLLMNYMKSVNYLDIKKAFCPLFSNRCGQKLTRKGVSHILNKYFIIAKQQNPGLYPEKLTPHCFRHSKSMHLLQSGVNLIYIRDLLGHVDIKTTEIYARIDSEMKRKALEKGNNLIPSVEGPSWKDNKDLLEWLSSLGK